jgi:hypothetical protein
MAGFICYWVLWVVASTTGHQPAPGGCDKNSFKVASKARVKSPCASARRLYALMMSRSLTTKTNAQARAQVAPRRPRKKNRGCAVGRRGLHLYIGAYLHPQRALRISGSVRSWWRLAKPRTASPWRRRAWRSLRCAAVILVYLFRSPQNGCSELEPMLNTESEGAAAAQGATAAQS